MSTFCSTSGGPRFAVERCCSLVPRAVPPRAPSVFHQSPGDVVMDSLEKGMYQRGSMTTPRRRWSIPCSRGRRRPRS